MKKNLIKVFFLILSVSLIPMSGFAQKKIEKVLEQKEVNKFAKADKLISKGDAIIIKADEIEKEIEALRNTDGRIKTRKINKKSKAAAKYKMQAAVYYKDGYNTKIKVLDKRLKALEKSGDSDAAEVRQEMKGLTKKARKQYNKAENLISYEEAVEMVEMAQENQQKAIDLMVKSLVSANTDEAATEEPAEELVEEMPVVTQDTVAVQVAEPEETIQNQEETAEQISEEVAGVAVTEVPPTGVEAAVAGTTVTAVAATGEALEEQVTQEEIAKEAIEETIEEPVVEPSENVFFTIQILAGKTKIADEKLKQAYSGPKEIMEMKGDGWFRYSIGKFNSIEKAREVQKAQGVKGFIVAYKDGQRISVKEAMELLSK